MTPYIICIIIGAIGMLVLQAIFDEALGWWADTVERIRAWTIGILCSGGVMFIIAAIAYANGWRP